MRPGRSHLRRCAAAAPIPTEPHSKPSFTVFLFVFRIGQQAEDPGGGGFIGRAEGGSGGGGGGGGGVENSEGAAFVGGEDDVEFGPGSGRGVLFRPSGLHVRFRAHDRGDGEGGVHIDRSAPVLRRPLFGNALEGESWGSGFGDRRGFRFGCRLFVEADAASHRHRTKSDGQEAIYGSGGKLPRAISLRFSHRVPIPLAIFRPQ
ncbi:hypothetical protein E3T29_15935 [Cryobacterium sp. TMT1-66-1]|nr:hypothetical protein E3T29_15935 [Cryobacterium sp. TMT1-66-1]